MVRKRVPGHLHRTSNRKGRSVTGPQLPMKSVGDVEESGPNAAEEQLASSGLVPSTSTPPVTRASGTGSIVSSGTGRVRPTQRGSVFRSAPRAAATPDLVADYQYVVHDLRQIGILTTMAVVVLIGLTFVIR